MPVVLIEVSSVICICKYIYVYVCEYANISIYIYMPVHCPHSVHLHAFINSITVLLLYVYAILKILWVSRSNIIEDQAA